MKKSFIVTRCHLLLIVFLVIVLLTAVGLLVGFLKQTEPCETVTPEYDELLMSSIQTTTTAPQEQGPWLDPFLPSCAVPNHYDLWLYPDFYFNGKSFQGKVQIDINITEDTKYLIVHCKEINIHSTQVRIKNGDTPGIVRQFAYDPHEFWIVEVDRTLTAGQQVILHAEFKGYLYNGFKGFYKSVYTNTVTGIKSWLVTTKFQPTDARLAFPHFDEPKFKATFSIRMKHWSNFTALSNMPAQETKEVGPGWSETTFQKSVLMSSYLVSFVVCDYVYTEKRLRSGKIHRVWTSSDKIEQTKYALDIGTKMVDYMEEEFGLDYHLPKLDQIAVPDFTAGAMEHWGLITYRQTSLLYDAETVAPSGKELVTLVIAHELVHNYFGNLVTCRWWNDIWLNEGFARFFQYKAIRAVHPDWLPEDYFVVRTEQGVMNTDAGAGAKPVLRNLVQPEDIRSAFSSITYDKGASLLRMIEDFMGREQFHIAMKAFLREYAFATANTQDLWDILQQHVVDSALNISTVMKPWTEQVGLPVVDITFDQNSISATQRRFLDNNNSDPNIPPSPFGYKWHIPLRYSTPGSSGLVWMTSSSVDIQDPRAEPEWIKFNWGQYGFYRVNYSPDTWSQLAGHLENNIEVFSPLDRAGLLDDAFNLARAAQLNYTIVLTLTKFLANETHYFPWKTSRSALEYIGDMLYGHQHYGLWRRFVRSLTDNALQRVKIQGGGKHLDQMLRADVIRIACSNGHAECIKNTSRLFFEQLMSNGTSSSLHPSIREEVYLSGMRNSGGEREFNILWGRYTKSNSPLEQIYFLKALSVTRESWLYKKFLGYCLDPQKISFQDLFTATLYASKNPRFNLYAWDWAKTNYNVLFNRIPITKYSLTKRLVSLASSFKTEYHLQEVEEFISQHSGNRKSTTLEKIKSNIEWRKTNENTIVNWLLENVK